MAVPVFSAELTFVAHDGDLRITGPQQVCFSLKEYLQSHGLTTGAFEITIQGTANLHSTAEFEVSGKTGDEVKSLIEAFLTEESIRASITTIPNPPDGFEVVYHLVDISVFRPN